MADREEIASLVRFHHRPFFLVDDVASQRLAVEISVVTRCDILALLAEADACGRICADNSHLLDNVGLFVEYCRELGCLTRSYPFASDQVRFEYFRAPGRDPSYAAYDDTQCESVVMSGLPGAGKDCWVSNNFDTRPVISLDALRREMRVLPTEPQSRVVQRAREIARSYLRDGKGLIWNATNVSRQIRASCIDLLSAYRSRVRIVYIETSEAILYKQNRERHAPVPEAAIDHLLARWEVPDRTEAHQVDWVVKT